MTRTDPAANRSNVARLVLRLALGVVFFAHGWQKIVQFTIPGTQAAFAEMGVPMAQLVAPLISVLELVGGAALILGLLVRVFGILLALDMLGALVLVHAPAGIFVSEGGYELVLVLAAGGIALALLGAGRFSIDGAVFGRSRNRVLSTLA